MPATPVSTRLYADFTVDVYRISDVDNLVKLAVDDLVGDADLRYSSTITLSPSARSDTGRIVRWEANVHVKFAKGAKV